MEENAAARTGSNVQRLARAAAALAVAGFVGVGAGRSTASEAPLAAPRTADHATSLCQDNAQVDRLVVRRDSNGSRSGFTFPGVVTVTGGSQASEVAAAVCALPVQHGTYSCPVGFGVSYRLTFDVRWARGPDLEAVAFDPTGCETLTGLGTNRWITLRQGFYRTLGTAMGLRDASQYTFIGTVADPSGPCGTGAGRVRSGARLALSPRAGERAPAPSR